MRKKHNLQIRSISNFLYAKKGNCNGIILQNELQIFVQRKTVQKCSPKNNIAWCKKATIPDQRFSK